MRETGHGRCVLSGVAACSAIHAALAHRWWEFAGLLFVSLVLFVWGTEAGTRPPKYRPPVR